MAPPYADALPGRAPLRPREGHERYARVTNESAGRSVSPSMCSASAPSGPIVLALADRRLLPQGAPPPLRLCEVRDGALATRDARGLAAVRPGGAALLLAGHGHSRRTTRACGGVAPFLGGLLAGHALRWRDRAAAPPSALAAVVAAA